jgi:uncharacterized protein
MRLTDRERNNIVSAVHHYDAQAQVYLFGSRVDDAKRGGDIDLLVRSASIGLAEKKEFADPSVTSSAGRRSTSSRSQS